ncbi:MAG: hypothetical protein KJ971_02605 [Firmicutes bacterium]|nr:hypothetical protein [Bacillota bacterium]
MNFWILLFLLLVLMFFLFLRIKNRIAKNKSMESKPRTLIYKYSMIILISLTGLFGALTINDWIHDDIPVTFSDDLIGAWNYNIYSDEYGEFINVLEYPVYHFQFTGSYVIFKVTNDSKFRTYIMSQESYLDEYTFNDITLYALKIDDAIYFLNKSNGSKSYTLFPAYVRVGNEKNIPVAPSEYFSLGTYASFTSGSFDSYTVLSWDEIEEYYATFYSDYVTVDHENKEIIFSTVGSYDCLITYDDSSIHIELIM